MNNSIFTYIHGDVAHSDTSIEYMQNLGMNEQTIESIHRMYAYELKSNVKRRFKEYSQHSDVLFVEWQYELAMGNKNASEFEAIWINAVMSIKSKYPLKTQISESAINE